MTQITSRERIRNNFVVKCEGFFLNPFQTESSLACKFNLTGGMASGNTHLNGMMLRRNQINSWFVKFRMWIKIRIRELSHARKLHHNMWMEIFIRAKTTATAMKSWLAVSRMKCEVVFLLFRCSSLNVSLVGDFFPLSVCGEYFSAYCLFCKWWQMVYVKRWGISDKRLNAIKLNCRFIKLLLFSICDDFINSHALWQIEL